MGPVTADPPGLPSGDVVRTVLGDVHPSRLGHTQPHEHLLCDMSGILDADEVEQPAGIRRCRTEPVRLDNYDWIRRHVLNRDNLQLLSAADATAELTEYKLAGGGTIVDSTPVGLGRDPVGCASISRATGVHIVMGCGYYVHAFHPPGLADLPEGDIESRMVRDLVHGIDDSGVRAGLIGEIGLTWPPHPTELTVLRAAVGAQKATGAPLQIHPGRDTDAPMHAIRTVLEAGGRPERTVMSHIDRTLWEPAQILELARTGCYLELDLFGQEASYYAFNPDARRPNDATRIDWLRLLIAEGFADRLLISQDICQKVYLRRYGGPGYTHILDNVLAQMHRMGVSQDHIRLITVTNPSAMLTWELGSGQRRDNQGSSATPQEGENR